MDITNLILPLRITIPGDWGLGFVGQLATLVLTVMANGAMWFFFAVVIRLAITGEVAW